MEVSHQTLNKLYEVYKDPDDEDMILTDGIERLCNDLNYQPDEFAILVLAWCLDASQMCRFTKTEFIDGLHKMRADTIASIRLRLEQTIEMLRVDAEMFKQLYRFTFRYREYYRIAFNLYIHRFYCILQLWPGAGSACPVAGDGNRFVETCVHCTNT